MVKLLGLQGMSIFFPNIHNISCTFRAQSFTDITLVENKFETYWNAFLVSYVFLYGDYKKANNDLHLKQETVKQVIRVRD